jgi:ABC-type sugar transport system permease subunit
MATVSAKPTISPPESEPDKLEASNRFRKKLRASLKAYLFLAPAMIILFVFHFFPIIYAFFLSLYHKISVISGVIPPSDKFSGFENYGTLFTNGDFWNALFNTIGYAVGVVVIGILLGLGLALLLDKVQEGRDFYRTAFFLPNVTSLVAVGAVWKVLFTSYSSTALAPANPDHPGGALNWIFSGFGLPMQRWLLDERGLFSLLFNNGNSRNPDTGIDWLPTIIEIAVAVISIGLLVALNYNLYQRAATERVAKITALVLTLPPIAFGLYLLAMQVINIGENPFGSLIAILVILALAFWCYMQVPDIRNHPLNWAMSYLGVVGAIAVLAALFNLAHSFVWKDWLSGPSLAMVCIIIIAIWHSLGFNVVILLAGLTNIPRELYEAARLDGARGFSMFWRMTVPLLSPTLFFLLIVSTITAFQSFSIIYAIFYTSGNSTTIPHTVNVLAVYYYQAAFGGGSGANINGFGYASTIVIFMLLFIVGLTLIQQRVLAKRVNYD